MSALPSALTRRGGPQGFTLIELLVVMGIIAVLMSLLIPTLSKARDSVRQTQCLTNYRTLGTAIAQYAVDNENTLVYVHDYWQSVAPSTQQRWTWDNFLDVYLGGPAGAVDSRTPQGHFKKVLVDPVDTSINEARTSSGQFVRSYALTRGGTPRNDVGIAVTANLTVVQAFYSNGSCLYWSIRDSSPTGSWLDPSAQPYAPFRPFRLNQTDFPKPSMTIMLTEKFLASNSQGDPGDAYVFPAYDSRWTDKHSGGSNYLYIDGHTETKAFKTTVGSGAVTWAYGDWDRLKF